MKEDTMQELIRLVICVIGFSVSMGITILTMTKGYGVSINSWPWIIAGTLMSLIVAYVTFAVIRSGE
jgi:hypothetical protein